MPSLDTLPRLLLVYAHLLATCVAVGALISTDVQLLRRIRASDFRIAPPNPLVMALVAAALIVVVASGALLIFTTPDREASPLASPKVQAKLILVALLIGNAFALHLNTFPRLASGSRIRPWRARWALGVALPLAMSHALWFFVAFLGIARPWNYTASIGFVLGTAAALILMAWAATMGVLHVTAAKQGTRRTLRKMVLRDDHPAVRSTDLPPQPQLETEPAPLAYAYTLPSVDTGAYADTLLASDTELPSATPATPAPPATLADEAAALLARMHPQREVGASASARRALERLSAQERAAESA